GMEISTVAEILENVLRFGKRRLTTPRHAFAAHMRERIGAAIHPRHHVMATDAAMRARAFRHGGRGVVRAARAVMRCAREVCAWQGELMFFRFDPRNARTNRFG